MELDGALRDEQHAGDVAVGLALRHQAQDVDLAARQVRGQAVLGDELGSAGATVLLLGDVARQVDRAVAQLAAAGLGPGRDAADLAALVAQPAPQHRAFEHDGEPRREVLQRIGVQLRQRAPARRAVAVQEPTAMPSTRIGVATYARQRSVSRNA